MINDKKVVFFEDEFEVGEFKGGEGVVFIFFTVGDEVVEVVRGDVVLVEFGEGLGDGFAEADECVLGIEDFELFLVFDEYALDDHLSADV